MKEVLDFLLYTKTHTSEVFINNETGTCSIYFSINDSWTNCYIGFTKNKPPRHHKNDLYMQIQQSVNWQTFCIPNLSYENAHVLESLTVKYLDITYGLHNIGVNNIQEGKALNKKRERKWEKLIPERIVNGNNIISLIGRQTDNY